MTDCTCTNVTIRCHSARCVFVWSSSSVTRWLPRLFAQYLAIYYNKNLPNSIKNYQSICILCQILNKPFTNRQRIYLFAKVAKLWQIWSHCDVKWFRSRFKMLQKYTQRWQLLQLRQKMFIGLDGIQNKSSVMLQINFSDVAYVCTFCVVKKWMS